MSTETFDFKQESEEILKRFPQLRSRAVFVTTENASRRMKSVAAYPHSQMFIFNAAAVAGLKARIKQAHEWGCSIASSSDDPPYDVVVFKHDDKTHTAFGPEHALQLQMTAMYHEAAHLLMPGAHPNIQVNPHYPIAENMPDAFATLMNLQRFETAQDVGRLYAWRRAYDFIERGISCHLTAPVIDGILDDAATTDFSKLTPVQVIETATNYAQRFTPREDEIRRARAAYLPFQGLLKKPETLTLRTLKQLAETALATSQKFTFYIGSRAIQPFLDGHSVTCKGQTLTMPEGMRNYYRREFATKAERLGDKKYAERLSPRLPAKKTDQPQGRSAFSVTINL